MSYIERKSQFRQKSILSYTIVMAAECIEEERRMENWIKGGGDSGVAGNTQVLAFFHIVSQGSKLLQQGRPHRTTSTQWIKSMITTFQLTHITVSSTSGCDNKDLGCCEQFRGRF